MARLVDFHCHLDLYPDHETQIERCEREGIFTLAVTTTPKAWARNNELASQTRHVRAALGLHPQVVAERAHELPIWEELLPRSRYVGEVGLDAGPKFHHSLGKQKEVFARVLSSCARTGGKILSVHSVRCTTVVLDMIEKTLPPPKGQVVLHWFSGTAAEARRAADLGCYFSINGKMLANNRSAALVTRIPRDRLLTETDGPFTAVDGRPSRPSDVAVTVSNLATTLGISGDACSQVILANLRRLVTSDTVSHLD